MDINCQMGQVLPLRLQIETPDRKMAKIYTDNPKLITFDESFQHQFELFPGTHNYVTYKLRSYKPCFEKVRVNCVDNFSKRLVQGWVFLINSTAVVPDQVFPINLTAHKNELLPPMPFVNKLNLHTAYEIESSSTEVIQVIQKTVKVDPNATGFVQLRAVGQTQTGPKEVFIFIVEENGSTSICWKLALNITMNTY